MVNQLSSFPNTILNLDDRPNLSAEDMKQALQQDVSVLWAKCMEIISSLNAKVDGSMGIYIGNDTPASVAADLSVGDVYLYAPDLP
jgi:hypothetical protein